MAVAKQSRNKNLIFGRCTVQIKQLEYFTIVWYLGGPCECHGSYTPFWAHQNWPHKVNNLFHFVSRFTRRRWRPPRRSQRRRGRSLRRAKRTWRPSRMTLGRRRTAMRIPRKTAQRKKVSVGHGDGMFLLVSREALAAGQPADVLSKWWVLHVSSLTKHQWRVLSQLWSRH